MRLKTCSVFMTFTMRTVVNKRDFCIGKYVKLINSLTPIEELETGQQDIQDFLLDNFLSMKQDQALIYDCIILLKRISRELSRRRASTEQRADFESRLP